MDSRARQPQAMSGARDTWVGVALVMVSTAIFGSIPAVVTFLRDDMPLVEVLTYRGLLAGAMLFALSMLVDRVGVRRGRARPVLRGYRWRRRNAGLIVGVLLYAPQLMLFYTAFDYIETSLAVALGYIYPTIVLFLVAIRGGRPPSPRELGLAFMALAGIVALTNPVSGAMVDVVGIVLVFVAAVFYALYVVVAGDLVADLPPLRVGGQVSVGVGLATAGYGMLSGTLGLPTAASAWLMLLVQAGMLTAAVATYYLGLVRLGASTTSLIDCAQPLFAVVVGSWLLAEQLVALQFIGLALVTLSVALTTALAHRRLAMPFADPP